MATNKPVIWVGWKQEYFSTYGWTAQISLNPFDKFAPARTGFLGHFEVREWARLRILPKARCYFTTSDDE
jgi:hypothetical protein